MGATQVETIFPCPHTPRAKRFRRGLVLLGCSALSLSLSGCAFETKGSDGSRHYLIIGAGLVSVNDQKSNAAVAVRTHSLGIALSDIPGMHMVAGYGSSKYVSVNDGSKDLIIEVADRPRGDMTVNVQGTETKKENEK